MALRLKPGAHIFTVEPHHERAAIARELLEYTGVADRVTIVCGKSGAAILQLCSGACLRLRCVICQFH